MARGPRYHVPYRRRREDKTDFRKRLRHLKSGMPRLVVRRTLTKTIVQVAEYSPEGDRVLAQASSPELTKMGWSASVSTVPAAYLTGLLAAKRAVEKTPSIGHLRVTALRNGKPFNAYVEVYPPGGEQALKSGRTGTEAGRPGAIKPKISVVS